MHKQFTEFLRHWLSQIIDYSVLSGVTMTADSTAKARIRYITGGCTINCVYKKKIIEPDFSNLTR